MKNNDLVDMFLLYLPERMHYVSMVLDDIKNLGIVPHMVKGYKNNMAKGKIDGIRKCEKEFFSWIDDDDRYPNQGALEDMLKKLKDSDAPFAYSAEMKIDTNGKRIDRSPIVNKYDFDMHMEKHSHVHGLIVIRRELIDDFLLNSLGRNIFFDSVLLRTLSRKYGPPVWTEKLGREWRQHPEQYHRVWSK